MQQPKITIYTASYCPYCTKSKELLASKGLVFEEIDVTDDSAARQALVIKAEGRKTVPQIFIGDKGIGGFTDLSTLDQSGDLKILLTK